MASDLEARILGEIEKYRFRIAKSEMRKTIEEDQSIRGLAGRVLGKEIFRIANFGVRKLQKTSTWFTIHEKN